jgi:hypothetical protein
LVAVGRAMSAAVHLVVSFADAGVDGPIVGVATLGCFAVLSFAFPLARRQAALEVRYRSNQPGSGR